MTVMKLLSCCGWPEVKQTDSKTAVPFVKGRLFHELQLEEYAAESGNSLTEITSFALGVK